MRMETLHFSNLWVGGLHFFSTPPKISRKKEGWMLRFFVENPIFCISKHPVASSLSGHNLEDFARNIVGWPAIPAWSVTTGNTTWDQVGAEGIDGDRKNESFNGFELDRFLCFSPGGGGAWNVEEMRTVVCCTYQITEETSIWNFRSCVGDSRIPLNVASCECVSNTFGGFCGIPKWTNAATVFLAAENILKASNMWLPVEFYWAQLSRGLNS